MDSRERAAIKHSDNTKRREHNRRYWMKFREERRKQRNKTELCIKNGPCKKHGELSKHASEECYVLHPELKQEEEEQKEESKL